MFPCFENTTAIDDFITTKTFNNFDLTKFCSVHCAVDDFRNCNCDYFIQTKIGTRTIYKQSDYFCFKPIYFFFEFKYDEFCTVCWTSENIIFPFRSFYRLPGKCDHCALEIFSENIKHRTFLHFLYFDIVFCREKYDN